jgi:aminopeptidase N
MSHRASLLLSGPAAGFARPHTRPSYAPDLCLEPTHLELHITPDIPARTLRCEATHTVRARAGGRRLLRLDAVDMEVHEVVSDDGHSLSHRHDGTVLELTWDAPVPAGEERRFTVRWTVEDPLAGLVFGGDSASTPGAGAFVATDHETERARYWLPCVDHPSARTTLELHLTVPEEHRALASGAKVGELVHDDGTRTVHWSLDFPCPAYLLCFVAGELVEWDGGAHLGPEGLVPVACFAPAPATPADLERSFAPTVDMLDWITTQLDSPYPFPKYYQFVVPDIGGAMENISLVSWDRRWLADPVQREELGWLLDLVNLHEMAHTWFGDAVVCRDYAHSWLKESWATYMESVWLEHTEGPDAMHAQLARERAAYFGEAKRRYVRPISTRHFESSWDMFDHHLYPGGAVRLHLLRTELGDAAFWDGVRAYLARYRGKVVETDDFRRVMEEHSGRSLARFFDDWFRRPGHPVLEASWDHDRDRGEATLRIRQTQANEKKGVGLFQLKVEVAIEEADGTWSHHQLALDEATASLKIPLAAPPQQVLIDPNSALPAVIRFRPGRDMLRRSLVHAASVRGRIWAGRELAARERAADLRAIAAAWEGEQVWGVREQWAAALGRATHPAAAAVLAGLVDSETDAKVMPALLAACAHHRDPALADAIVDWLGIEDRGHRARGAALAALGAQRDPRLLPHIEAGLAPGGWNGWEQRGAIRGLGQARDPRLVELLFGVIDSPESDTLARATAAEALVGAVGWGSDGQRAEVRDRLVELSRDPAYAVRMAAGRALGALGDPAAAGALDHLAARVAVQDRPRVERLRAGLLKQGSGDERRLERLEDQLKRLTERVDRS